MSATTLIVASLLLVLCQGDKLIFEENFDTLNEATWQHSITTSRGGNNEFQIYRNNRKNSWVEDGILKIRPTLVSEELSDAEIRNGYINIPYCNEDPCVSIGVPGGDCIQPVYSAKLTSKDRLTVGYGVVKIRAKMPRGDWLWPAIWMMPNDNVYGGWPASGEIDIVESRGNRRLKTQDGTTVGVDLVGQTMHWGPRWPFNAYYLTHWEKRLTDGTDFSDDFHIYEIERRPTKITFRIDGEETGSISPENGFWRLGGFDQNPGGRNLWESGGPIAPFDQGYYFVINIAVGGNFFDDSYVNEEYPRPWNWYDGHPMTDFYESAWRYTPTWDRPTLEVDYIHVYE